MHSVIVRSLIVILMTLPLASAAVAAINPFTEDFAGGHANWFNSQATAPVTWMADGGPDGSSYVSTTFNFKNLTPGLPFPNNAVNLFRAQDEFNSSNHAFEGNWIADGVTELSFDVRHIASSPMTFFVRFATANNFPAWSGVEFTATPGNTWTHISIPISLSNPNLFFEGPPGGPAQFSAVFSNIGHIQVGVFAGGLAGIDQDFRFDLDRVTIVPVPGAGMIMAMGVFALGVRRRKRAST